MTGREIDYESRLIDWESLIVAVNFFPTLSGDMVIQVPHASMLPEVKRMLIKLLGQPGFNHATKLKYGSRYIHIDDISSLIGEYGTPNIFYVGYVDGRECQVFKKQQEYEPLEPRVRFEI